MYIYIYIKHDHNHHRRYQIFEKIETRDNDGQSNSQ